MKFTSIAVSALLIANTSAVVLRASDDCDGKWCNKGLSYDYDKAPLTKAEGDYASKSQKHQGADNSFKTAQDEYAAASATAEAAAAADKDAAAAKAAARADLLNT